MVSCPFCDCTSIRKEPDVIYGASEIKGVRETCDNPDCNYTQFIADTKEETQHDY